jgi:hypothetical protein
MKCITEILALFKGETMCEAICLAVVAFILGALVTLILCKLFCPCGKKAAKKRHDRPQQREDRPFEKRKPHPAPADGTIEIYVGNLSYEMTEDQLRAEFEAYGKVNSARIITNRYTNHSKGFGFVHMPNRDEAEKACAALNDKEILGRKMKCNEAKNIA